MISSDSEDDCYGNIAQKLQSLKDTYHDDEVKSATYLSRSDTSDLKAGKTKSSVVKDAISAESVEISVNTSLNSTDNDELTLDTIIAQHSKCTLTRSKKRKSAKDDSFQKPPKESARGKRKGRGRKSTSAAQPTETSDVREVETETASHRRRERGNTQTRTRGRRRADDIRNVLCDNLPVYSVGNTDEYPDLCDNQPIFASVPDVSEVQVIEQDPLDDNEEISVKVYWQTSEFFRFTIRKYQKLVQIFEYFSAKENVSQDKLLFTYNDKILNADDTPDSIGYNFVKFIDGGVTINSVPQSLTKNTKTKKGIAIKFQCQNVKKPYEMVIGEDDKLMVAMIKCAEQMELPLKKLKFLFDGETMSGSCTPRELELEGGECVDVKIIS